MSYSFRIRFNCSPHSTIQCEHSKLTVSVPDKGIIVTLCNPQADQPIKDADQLVLTGSGYESRQAAAQAGLQFQNALKVALARVRVGADFGERAAKGCYTPTGLNMLAEQHSRRVLNNTHGLMIYLSEPKPLFASMDAQAIRGFNPEIFATVLTQAIAQRPPLSDRDQLAYSLFNASFFQRTADSRFLLLVMAVEALIDPALCSPEGLDHVNSLISATRAASLPDVEKESMIGALRWLRTESINQAGRRLALIRLGTRIYDNKPATDFFSYCYKVRSDLVHGNLPVPTFEQVGNLAGTLEVFVSDLLTTLALGHPQRD